MQLVPLVNGEMWLCPYPVRLAGTRFTARMTVIRLTCGTLMLHSPCAITPELSAELRAIGPVGHIIAPGNFHHIHVVGAQRAFPAARIWMCPGTERRGRALTGATLLQDHPPPDWSGDLDQVLVRARIMSEVAMLHRRSRTLLLVDLIENFTQATPGLGGALRFWFRLLGMWNTPGPAPEYWIAWGDRPAVAAALRRILQWDFQRIVLGHGDLILHDARQVAEMAWSGILARE